MNRKSSRLASVGGGGGFNFSCSSEKAAILILPNGATCEIILVDRFKRLALENAHRWVEFAEMNEQMVRWHGKQYSEVLPLCIVTEVLKTNQWALSEVSNTSQGAGFALKLLAPAVEGNVSGSYLWEMHSPAASHVVPPPISEKLNHSVFIKALRIKFQPRPLLQPKVDISVYNKIKPNHFGHGPFCPLVGPIGSLGSGRPNPEVFGSGSGGGSNVAEISGFKENSSSEAVDHWSTVEREVSVEPLADVILVRKHIAPNNISLNAKFSHIILWMSSMTIFWNRQVSPI